MNDSFLLVIFYYTLILHKTAEKSTQNFFQKHSDTYPVWDLTKPKAKTVEKRGFCADLMDGRTEGSIDRPTLS